MPAIRASFLFTAVSLLPWAAASRSDISAARQLVRARLLQDTPIAGFGSVRPISEEDGAGGDESEREVAEDLVEALMQDEQVTAVGDVQLGALSCDSLTGAEDADMLQFTIGADDTIIAQQLSYEVVDGSAFGDGMPRSVWSGEVIDYVPGPDEAGPKIVSMSWGNSECNPETFLLKVTTQDVEGMTSVLKSVPCSAGSATELCMVEMSLELKGSALPLSPDDVAPTSEPDTMGTTSRRLRASNVGRSAARRSNEDRKLQTSTEIDVMMLYSDLAKDQLGGISDEQMTTIITDAIASTNEAFASSDLDVHYRLVHVGQLPYDQQSGSREALYELDSNAEIAALRDEYGADLVQLVGQFSDYCGVAWLYWYGQDQYGFSTVGANCFYNFSHTHEFGHNMGAHHDRENSDYDEEYSHGMRYCSGDDPLFRTVMSYSNSCWSAPVINYFSNPDVDYLEKPTGTSTEDNARVIRETMETISNWREPADTTTPEDYSFVGCFADNTKDRVLSGDAFKNQGSLTIDSCASLCAGSTYFGTEFGKECFCGPSSDDPSRLGDATCNMECNGDASETCGGRNAISVYEFTDDSPSGYAGCFVDSTKDRVLTGQSKKNDPNMTSAECAEFCGSAPFYGTQFSSECFCGVEGDDFERLGVSDNCNMECTGDDSEICGGRSAMSVYYGDDTPPPTSTYKGCYTDTSNRIMATRILVDGDNMTNELCESACSGYSFFGTQDARECWCGDESTDYEQHGSSEACASDCPGDATDTCGGRWAMSVYEL